MSSIPTTTPAENAPRPEEEVPWWMKYAGRGMGTFGGVGKLFPDRTKFLLMREVAVFSNDIFQMHFIAISNEY
jgi:hypothetical protein